MALNNLFCHPCVTPACRSVSTRRQVLTLVALATIPKAFGTGVPWPVKNLHPLPIQNSH